MADAIDSNARNKLIFRLESAGDAAAMAKLAPGLDPEDFQLLPRHHAYARVVVDGESSGWCTIKTNPPPQPTGLADSIIQRSRELYGGVPPSEGGHSSSGRGDSHRAEEVPVGRKRRIPAIPNDSGVEEKSNR